MNNNKLKGIFYQAKGKGKFSKNQAYPQLVSSVKKYMVALEGSRLKQVKNKK